MEVTKFVIGAPAILIGLVLMSNNHWGDGLGAYAVGIALCLSFICDVNDS